MRISRAALLLIIFAAPAGAEAPLSAIDWLSQSVVTPVAQPMPTVPPVTEPAITKDSALPGDVSVSVLGGPDPDAVGLLPPQVTGLPRNLWGLGRSVDIASSLFGSDLEGLPALQGLLITLLLAEADAPVDGGGMGRLLVARIDRLLALGALDQARALLDAAGPQANADLFRRSFDVALLTGDEDRACDRMRATPNLAPTFPARIFCLARSGDWNAAALTLRTAEALGHVTEAEAALLSRFLDPDLYEGEAAPPAPTPITPLAWRMFEAIGEPVSTTGLPLAFAHAELRDTAGWKAQIEAAERLARAGAISPNVLLGLYTERMPAASGGVWDRADAFQDFDAALARRDTAAVAQSLTVVWTLMSSVELEVPFAVLFGDPLATLPLTGPAATLAFEIGLLSPGYRRIAAAQAPEATRAAFLAGLAAGDLTGLTAPDSMGRAIAPAYAPAPEIGAEAALMIAQNRTGEAILWAMGRIAVGVQGDLRGVGDGLAVLRKLGLTDVAARTALELMLLERRG